MNAPVDYDALLAQLAPHLSKGELEQCELMHTRAPGGFRRQVAALAQKYAKQLASPLPGKETPRQADGPGEAAEIKESSQSIDLDISASAMTPSACRAASGTISIMVHHLPPSAMLDGSAWRAGGRPRKVALQRRHMPLNHRPGRWRRAASSRARGVWASATRRSSVS